MFKKFKIEVQTKLKKFNKMQLFNDKKLHTFFH